MKKFGIAVVGCGRISASHLKGIGEMRDIIDLVATVDIIPERADRRKDESGARKAYYSLEDALRDGEIEGVVLCLPHYLHHPISIQCIQAGKHVLVEKEMSTGYASSLDMVKEAERAKVTLMVGQSRRFYDAVQQSIRTAHGGEIGDIFNVIAIWHLQMKSAATEWWRSRSKAGGLLVALNGSHFVDYITWLRKYELPARVYCQLNHLNPDWEGEDEVTMVLTYADNSTASIHLSFNMAYSRHIRIIEGTKGNMVLDDETALIVNGQTVVSGEQKPSNFALQVKEFVTAVREGREPICSGRIVAPVNAVLEAAFASAGSNQPVDMRQAYPELFAAK